MKIESPAAFRFIMDEELYLLNADKADLAAAKPAEPVMVEVLAEPEPVVMAVSPAVETPAQPEPAPVAAPPAFAPQYLGKNQKGLLILVHYTAHQFMADDHLTALTNILKRKELSIDDVAIANIIHHPDASFEQFCAFFKPQKVLLMGQKTLIAGIEPLAVNQLKQAAGRTLLHSLSFDEMMTSNDHKKAFWDQMKNL